MARILVIDDDRALCGLLRAVLHEAGHEVEAASDGAAGLRLLRDRPEFDLVLCDLFMAGTDGLQTIRALRRGFPGLPVVAISGGGFGGTVDMLPVARLLGAARCLHKPFSLQALVATVDDILAQVPIA
jgi:CheY-like chemotaxis protein